MSPIAMLWGNGREGNSCLQNERRMNRYKLSQIKDSKLGKMKGNL